MAQYASNTMARGGLNEASQDASPSAPEPTLGGALASLTDLGELANGTAEFAERIASHIAGVAPPSESASRGGREADSLTDALNHRANTLRDPITRIRNALARIERRIG